MMIASLRRSPTRAAAIALIVPVALVLGFGVYLANLSGDLPWQVDPTRIPITPFASLAVSDPSTPIPAS